MLNDLGMTKKSVKAVDQGIECDSSHIYVMWLSRAGYYARIATYNWSGELVAKYQFAIGGEVEHIALTNDKVYVGVNNGGLSKAYAKKKKLCARFLHKVVEHHL